MNEKLLKLLLGAGGGAALGGLGGGVLSSSIKGDEDETLEDRQKRIRDSAVIGSLLGATGGGAIPAASILTGGTGSPEWLERNWSKPLTTLLPGYVTGRLLLGGNPTLNSISRFVAGEKNPPYMLKQYIKDNMQFMRHNNPQETIWQTLRQYPARKINNIKHGLKLFMGTAVSKGGDLVVPEGFRYPNKMLRTKGTGLITAALAALATGATTGAIFNSRDAL
ncbi:hypothetical protein ACFLQL_00135 [Verrucomicrobiota bacterium]